MSSKGANTSPLPPSTTTTPPSTTTTSKATNESLGSSGSNITAPTLTSPAQPLPIPHVFTTPFTSHMFGFSPMSQPQTTQSSGTPSHLPHYPTQPSITTPPSQREAMGYYVVSNPSGASVSALSSIPSSYSTHITPTEVATPLPLVEGDANQLVHHINHFSRLLQQDPCPVLRQCLVCARGPPQCLVRTPTWATIMRIVLYTLKFDMPNRDFFNLRTDVYGFMLHHWDKICIQKKQTEYWHKQIQDVLSHNKELFESGMELYKQNGYWRLRILDDPWVLLKKSVPRTRKRSVDVETIKEISEKHSEEKEKPASSSKTQPKGKRASGGNLAWTPKVEGDSSTNPSSSPPLMGSAPKLHPASNSLNTSTSNTNNSTATTPSESPLQNNLAVTSSNNISTHLNSSQNSLPSPSYYQYPPNPGPMYHAASQPSISNQGQALSYVNQKPGMYLHPVHSYPSAYPHLQHIHPIPNTQMSMQPKIYPLHPTFPIQTNPSYMIPSYSFPVCVGEVPLSIHPEMPIYQWDELSNYPPQQLQSLPYNNNLSASSNDNNNINTTTTTNTSTISTNTQTPAHTTNTHQHPLNTQSEWDQKETPYYE
eukprot:TRINITY_DN734_c0_g2_i2.p1 TRINITY_DN734_c0_g2~~TRINITY_DN734_c0_g2_i2.p1  ORF type:complete len:594 (-),score=129.28 TRINITY_DN734_c0_g2_i2:176-1957(-)